MASESTPTRPAQDVFDPDTLRELFAAMLRKVISGDLDRGDFRLESDNPAIDGMTLIVPEG